jgi:hypothetical protein
MIGFIIAAIIAVLLIVAYSALEARLIKKHGIPELPDDIKLMDTRIENESIRLDLT